MHIATRRVVDAVTTERIHLSANSGLSFSAVASNNHGVRP